MYVKSTTHEYAMGVSMTPSQNGASYLNGNYNIEWEASLTLAVELHSQNFLTVKVLSLPLLCKLDHVCFFTVKYPFTVSDDHIGQPLTLTSSHTMFINNHLRRHRTTYQGPKVSEALSTHRNCSQGCPYTYWYHLAFDLFLSFSIINHWMTTTTKTHNLMLLHHLFPF